MTPDANKGRSSGSRLGHPPRIVVINQEPMILEIWEIRIRQYFKNGTILLFKDGDLALQELSQTEPDLLITDMHRPGMDGWKMLPLLAAKEVKYPLLVEQRNVSEVAVRRCAGSELNLTVLRGIWRLKTFYTHLGTLVGPSDNPEFDCARLGPDDRAITPDGTGATSPKRIPVLDVCQDCMRLFPEVHDKLSSMRRSGELELEPYWCENHLREEEAKDLREKTYRPEGHLEWMLSMWKVSVPDLREHPELVKAYSQGSIAAAGSPCFVPPRRQ
jgi:CheY-like chemotaxis protein